MRDRLLEERPAPTCGCSETGRPAPNKQEGKLQVDCQQAAELMPWYLNGTLDAAERAELEEHLGGCDVCRAELRETETARVLFGGHPTAGLLVDYAFDRPEAPRDVVEAHLADLRRLCRRAGPGARQPAPAGRRAGGAAPRADRAAAAAGARARPRWRAAAVAAAVLGLIGVGGGLWSWRALDGERDAFAERQRAAEIRIAELEARIHAASRRRPAQRADPRSVARRLGPAVGRRRADQAAGRGWPGGHPDPQHPAGRPTAAVDRLEIRDGDGRVLQSLTDLRTVPGRSLTMSLALASLPRGKLQILLFGPDGSEPVESYTFELD